MLQPTVCAEELLELRGLRPAPETTWRQMREFSGPAPTELDAMRATVEPLLRHANEMVVATYDHLLATRETAAILGWEHGPDPEHLAERRRFFAIWLARTLGLDFGDDLARYLFHAGQLHAGHGPRRVDVPDRYVTGSIGLVISAFAGYISAEHGGGEPAARAVAGWNKYLLMQLEQMLAGRLVAKELDQGEAALPVRLYGRMRDLAGRRELVVHGRHETTVADVLRKFFDYLPALREEALDRAWHEEIDPASLWSAVEPVYLPRRGWRVLVNGRDVAFERGFATPVGDGDTVDLFPPGR